MKQDEVINIWCNLKDQIKDLQTKERELRNYLIKNVIGDSAVEEGTVNKVLSDNRTLQAVFALDRKVDMTAFDAVAGNEIWDTLPNKILKWEPKLSVALYRSLTSEQQNFIDNLLIVKPASTALSLVIKND